MSSPSHQTFLRPAVLIGDETDHNLRLAAQAGATDLVGAYPGTELAALQASCNRAASFGLKLTTIERLWPHDKIVHNKPGRAQQIQDTKTLIRNMGATGVKILCYNWMPADDWSRTSTETPTRGGSLVTAFDINAKEATLDSGAADYRGELPEDPTSAEELWCVWYTGTLLRSRATYLGAVPH